MNPVLVRMVLAFAIPWWAAGDAPAQPPASSPTTRQVGKQGERRALPPAAIAALDMFRQALREADWGTAVSCCTAATRARARGYPSEAEYLRDCVPIEALLAESSYRSCGGKVELIDDKQEPVRLDFFLRLPQPSGEETVSWPWSLERTAGAWLVDLPEVSVAEWTKQDIARQRRQKEEADAKWKRLEPKLTGLRTQLIALQDEYRLGQPMPFRLELVNAGPYELSYDKQQVAVNAHMTITFEDGRTVPYTAGPVQTQGAPRAIRAGETAVLFDALDIAKQYDLTKPGNYRVQFNGHGLEVGDALGVDNGLARQRFPSNTVEIDVKP